ncbi:MAG: hypothetical protein AB8B96_17130 [Lysobacterales bacterium]
MDIATDRSTETTTPKSNDALIGKLIFAVNFALLLPVALIAAASGWRWRPWAPGAHGYRPVFSETRLKAIMLTAMVFSA